MRTAAVRSRIFSFCNRYFKCVFIISQYIYAFGQFGDRELVIALGTTTFNYSSVDGTKSDRGTLG